MIISEVLIDILKAWVGVFGTVAALTQFKVGYSRA